MDIPPSWKALLEEENRAVTLRNIRTLAIIAMIGEPACGLLDVFAYPALFMQFFLVRIFASFIEIGLLLITYTAIGQAHLRLLMLMVPLVPQVSIAWMMRCSGDPGSPYYAGLGACLVGVGFLFQWSYVEALLASGITLLIYLLATVPILKGHTWDTVTFGEFVNNGLFLLLNSSVIVTGSLVHERIRNNEVIARIGLAESRKELEQKNVQLVEADRMKTDFFSNVTHELRTPLTLMIAPLQRLQRLYPPEADGKRGIHEELGGIYQSGLRLLKLINNLLDLSSADAGQLKISRQEFSLDQFTGKVLHSVNTMAHHGGVTVERHFETGADLVSADQEKMEKILLNLLFNAVKFTPRGGTVRLVARDLNDKLVFEVEDTGVGISEKHLPFIFDRFWQADSSATRRHPGTGIGLALVKELVEKMGGTVVARSELGVGTTMQVFLPVDRSHGVTMIGNDSGREEETTEKPVHESGAAAPEEVAPEVVPAASADEKSGSAAWIRSIYREAEHTEIRPAETSPGVGVGTIAPILPVLENDGQKPLVLIVDDDPGMLNFIKTELEAEYRVIDASDGETALRLVEEHQPDLVVSDYMMPKLDGLSFCRIVRSRPESRMTPVMLVTARSDEEVRLNALRNGANDVLIKPFSLTEFHTRIHNLVHAGILQKQLEVRNAELVRTLEELRAAERDLIQSEKMASLGILTGGIMHEINNPLNFARSALYVLQRKTGKLEETKRTEFGDVLTDIGESISRISAIISDLRTFCHPESAMASSCPIIEPLQSAVRILAAPLKEARIEMHEKVQPDLLVRGDRNQLTLVFLNLIKNAVDALAADMPGRTELARIWVSARPDGQMLQICVKDNGPGIPEGNLVRVFDPFFTTKPAGEGTGLGLSMCYRIITAHGGAISVFSGTGKGTEFVLRIPMVIVEPRPRQEEEVEELALTS